MLPTVQLSHNLAKGTRFGEASHLGPISAPLPWPSLLACTVRSPQTASTERSARSRSPPRPHGSTAPSATHQHRRLEKNTRYRAHTAGYQPNNTMPTGPGNQPGTATACRRAPDSTDDWLEIATTISAGIPAAAPTTPPCRPVTSTSPDSQQPNSSQRGRPTHQSTSIKSRTYGHYRQPRPPRHSPSAFTTQGGAAPPLDSSILTITGPSLGTLQDAHMGPDTQIQHDCRQSSHAALPSCAHAQRFICRAHHVACPICHASPMIKRNADSADIRNAPLISHSLQRVCRALLPTLHASTSCTQRCQCTRARHLTAAPRDVDIPMSRDPSGRSAGPSGTRDTQTLPPPPGPDALLAERPPVLFRKAISQPASSSRAYAPCSPQQTTAPRHGDPAGSTNRSAPY